MSGVVQMPARWCFIMLQEKGWVGSGTDAQWPGQVAGALGLWPHSDGLSHPHRPRQSSCVHIEGHLRAQAFVQAPQVLTTHPQARQVLWAGNKVHSAAGWRPFEIAPGQFVNSKGGNILIVVSTCMCMYIAGGGGGAVFVPIHAVMFT